MGQMYGAAVGLHQHMPTLSGFSASALAYSPEDSSPASMQHVTQQALQSLNEPLAKAAQPDGSAQGLPPNFTICTQQDSLANAAGCVSCAFRVICTEDQVG